MNKANVNKANNNARAANRYRVERDEEYERQRVESEARRDAELAKEKAAPAAPGGMNLAGGTRSRRGGKRATRRNRRRNTRKQH